MTENLTDEDLKEVANVGKKSKPWYKKVNKKIALFSAIFFLLGSTSTFIITNMIHPKPSMEHSQMKRPDIRGNNTDKGNNQNFNEDESDTKQSSDAESGATTSN